MEDVRGDFQSGATTSRSQLSRTQIEVSTEKAIKKTDKLNSVKPSGLDDIYPRALKKLKVRTADLFISM